MGKVSVVTVVRAKLRYHLGRDSQAPEFDHNVEALARSCVKAAKKMLRLFEEIQSTGNLTRFSFTDFQACSIATIVIQLAGILERDAGYERQVSFGLDCLKKMAEGNVTAKMGVGFVEVLQSIANEAFEKLLQAKNHTSILPDELVPEPSDYNSWASWLSRQHGPSTTVETGSCQQLPADATLQSTSTASWAVTQAQSPPSGFAPWAGATALQQLSVPSPATIGLTQTSQSSFEPQNMDNGFLSTMYNDDQAFLMGLTGFDVLGFSGLQDDLQVKTSF